tara:strand:- start:2513 stop:5383 length:2871 start_codon:yes stop_codon:yes gene_type:complete
MGKSKRQNKKSMEQLGKVSTGLWEQSFLIANMKQFVAARISEYEDEVGDRSYRIGEWVGVHGDLRQMMGLFAQAQDVEAFNNLSAAQLSSLKPLIRIEKRPTQAALEIMPELTSEPQEIVMQSYTSTADILNSRPKWAGLVDVVIQEKAQSRGTNMAGSVVDLKFKFDSMATFVENQNMGVSFMDLIPGKDALSKTAGESSTLYEVLLTIGWQPVENQASADILFPGQTGRIIMDSISRAVKRYTLQDAGEFDINIQDDGSVELSVKYFPIAAARKREGRHAQLREDILGGPAGPNFKELRDEMQKLQENLEAEKATLKDNNKKINTAREQLRQEQRKLLEDELRNKKSSEDLAAMSDEERAEFEQQIAGQAFKLSNEYEPPGTNPEAGEEPSGFVFDGDKLQEFILDGGEAAELKQKLDDQWTKFEDDQMDMQFENEDLLENIRDFQNRIAELKSWNLSEGILNDRYSNLVRQMIDDGTMRFVEITAAEQQKAFAGSDKQQNEAAQKFRNDKLMDLIYKGGAMDTIESGQETTINSSQVELAEILKDLEEKSAGELGESAVGNPKSKTKIPSQVRQAESLAAKDTNNRRIYYFYLGDMLDIVMKNWYNQAETVSAGDIWKQTRKRESLILPSFYYSEKVGKKIDNLVFHMGDFPISFYAFNDWFVSSFIRKGISNISLSAFLASLAEDFFNQHPSIINASSNQSGPFLNSTLPDQPFEMMYDFMTTKGQVPRGQAQREVGGFFKVSDDFFRSIFKAKGDSGAMAAMGVGATPDYGYHFFGPAPVENQIPPVPTFSLHLGSAKAFLKNVKYTRRNDNKYLKEMKRRQGTNPSNKLGVPTTYDVEINMLGAPFMECQQIFDLNNNVWGLVGGKETLDDIMPRIMTVLEVEHKISNGEFTTSITATPSVLEPRRWFDLDGVCIDCPDNAGNLTIKKSSKSKMIDDTWDPAHSSESMLK